MSDTREKKISDIVSKLERGEKANKPDLEVIESIIADLDQGKIRIATPNGNGAWTTHAWIKQAVLLYFRTQDSVEMSSGVFQYFDKVPLKKWSAASGVRSVPPAAARYGSFVEPGAILMPSYINIGAYVGSGTMVDTWATVGSCAQIGKNVHLSGGVGIGGVLEPLQASPVIVEDDAFLGSRCIVVEGVHIERGAVLAAGLTLTASTKIVDVTGEEEKITKGRVPANAVLIPGSINKTFPAGIYGTACALLIGYRQESTDRKTSLNQALREFNVSV